MVTRWLRIGLPALLLVVWLVVSAIGGPAFGTISAATNNDRNSFLPASAESTRVQALQDKAYGSRAVPLIVLFVADSGLDSAQTATISSKINALSAVPGVESVASIGTSKDNRAFEIIAQVPSKANASAVVAAVRVAMAKDLPANLVVKVTGPAAFGADFGAGFRGIDGILLLVALAAVFVILLVVYRSLMLPIIVLLTSMFALTGSILGVYLLAKAGWLTVTGQSRGILSILALGAATDYSLLLVSRFREELRRHQTSWQAMVLAWRRSLEPIAASAATVIVAVLCLLLSGLNSNRGLGPVAAIAIALSFLAAVTALPAMLLLTGRAGFWPFRPTFEQTSADLNSGAAPIRVPIGRFWSAVGRLISRRPRATWIVSVVLLGCASLGMLQLKANGVPQTALLLVQSDSVDGQKLLAKHFAAGSGNPVVIAVTESAADSTLELVSAQPGISSAEFYGSQMVELGSPIGRFLPNGAQDKSRPPTLPIGARSPEIFDGKVLIEATLSDAPDSDEATAVVVALREELARKQTDALVGGVTALNLDTNTTALRDLGVIIPVVLAMIFLVLALLLRSISAPLLLIGTVVISFGATLGISALVFNNLLHFPGADPSVPLFGFVFLVALGVDYNIFLMTRVREESAQLGTRRGIVQGLGATGGVITSAGIVLAATFSALGVIPILFLVQIAFIVAFGVLLDTVLVRTLLVPALAYDIGPKIWWPSKLARAQQPEWR